MLFLFLLIPVTIVSAILLSAWGWYLYSHRRLLAVARTLPTVAPALPLIGHLHHLGFNTTGTLSGLFKYLYHPEYKNSCLWLGPFPIITVYRPEDVQKALSSSKALGKPLVYKQSDFFSRKGLLTASAYFWRKTRKHINPVFHLRNLQHVVANLNDAGRELVQDLSQFTDKGNVDVFPQIYPIALKSVFSLTSGPDVAIDAKSEEIKDVLQTFKRNAVVWTLRTKFVWLRWHYIYKFIFRKHLEKMEGTWKNILRMIPSMVCENKEMKIQEKTNIARHESGVRTIADVMCSLRQTDAIFDDKYVRGEIQTILATGTDTLTTTLCSCLVALGIHRDVQDKVYNEIIQVVGDGCGDMTMEDANKMTYLDQVLKETMRIFNVVSFVGRNTEEDLNLSTITIPAGSDFFIILAGLHMNPEIYPDPEKFDPDRFTPENVAQRERFSFLPFGGGIRDCVGKQYAMAHMKITLSHVLREYDIYSDMNISEAQFKYAVVLVSKDGYNVQLKRRKQHKSVSSVTDGLPIVDVPQS